MSDTKTEYRLEDIVASASCPSHAIQVPDVGDNLIMRVAKAESMVELLQAECGRLRAENDTMRDKCRRISEKMGVAIALLEAHGLGQ